MERRIGNFYVDGLTLEYSIIGEGKPIFVLHGGHSNCHEAFGNESLLENGFSLITPSRAGYGDTCHEIGESLSSAPASCTKLIASSHVTEVHLAAVWSAGPGGI